MAAEASMLNNQQKLIDCVKRFFGFGHRPDSISIVLPAIQRARPSSLICKNYPLFNYDMSPDDVFTALRVYSFLVLLYGDRIQAQPPRDLTGSLTGHYVSIGSPVTNKFTAQSLEDQYYYFGSGAYDHDIFGGKDSRYTLSLEGADGSENENLQITQDYALITRISSRGYVEVNLSGSRAYGQMALWHVLKDLKFYLQVLPEVEGKDFQILLRVKVDGYTCTEWDIIDIRPGSDTTTPNDDLPVHRVPETITWLHLSDLHLRGRNDFDSNIVLKALLNDIYKLRTERALSADFIVVTGDIAYTGKPHD